MTLEALKAVLEGTGLPTVYGSWPTGAAPALPWLCFRALGSDNLFADGDVYYTGVPARVELYSRRKDPATEDLVEYALSIAGIPWEKTETFVQSEDCNLITYEIEV